jgi:hypothetical protein
MRLRILNTKNTKKTTKDVTTLAKTELLQIFMLVSNAGCSKTFSISFEYDTEFASVNLYFWRSLNPEDVTTLDRADSKNNTYKEMYEKLLKWSEIISAENTGLICFK